MNPILWIILAILSCILYFWSALSVPSETVIIQTSLDAFNPELLNEKNPVLIQDRVANIDDFINTAFHWIWVENETINGCQNKHSFVVFHPSEDMTLNIRRPGQAEAQELAVIVPADMVFILPMRWHWSTNTKIVCKTWCVNTLFGKLFGTLL